MGCHGLMFRVLLVVCACVGLADARPTHDRPASTSTEPLIVAAERAWAVAAAETDPAKAVVAWESAADAFAKVLAMPGLHPQERASAARAAAIARFTRANLLRGRGELDAAIAGFEEVLAKHRDHEVAEYAANLLLDSLNRLQRYEHLIAVAGKLRADKPFLANKHDLAATVEKIYARGRRMDAQKIEQHARQLDQPAGYERCGERYLQLHDELREDRREATQALYNAMVCFQQARAFDRARAAATKVRKEHRGSSIEPRVVFRLIAIERDAARFPEAAKLAEEALKRYPRERDAPDLASDAIGWLIALGEYTRAERIATRFVKHPRTFDAHVALLASAVDRGDRKAARRIGLVVAKRALAAPRTADSDVQVGALLAAAGCRVPLVDERCPRVRDPELAIAAQRLLRRAARGGTP